MRQPFAIGGSGSTYVFGFVDSNFKKDMTEEECVEFVKKSKLGKLTQKFQCLIFFFLQIALTLAMNRDGSSGGVVRLGIINEKGIKRQVFSGEELPRFYEG